MNEPQQRKFFNFLLKKGVNFFIGVPDSTLKFFIDEASKKNKIIITTREDEAIGLGTGIALSDQKCLIFMQNAGFANSISTITSLVQLYHIPMIFLIGWRGYLSDDAPEHTKIGKIQPDLLKLINIPSKILNENNIEKNCAWAIDSINKNKTCALIIKRDFHD